MYEHTKEEHPTGYSCQMECGARQGSIRTYYKHERHKPACWEPFVRSKCASVRNRVGANSPAGNVCEDQQSAREDTDHTLVQAETEESNRQDSESSNEGGKLAGSSMLGAVDLLAVVRRWLGVFKSLRRSSVPIHVIDKMASEVTDTMEAVKASLLHSARNILPSRIEAAVADAHKTGELNADLLTEVICEFIAGAPELELPACVKTRWRRDHVTEDLRDSTPGIILKLPTDNPKHREPGLTGFTRQYNRRFSDVIYDLSRNHDLVSSWCRGAAVPAARKGGEVHWHPANGSLARTVRSTASKPDLQGLQATGTLLLDWFSDDVCHGGGKCRNTNRLSITHSYVSIRNGQPQDARNVNAYRTVHLSFAHAYGKGEEQKKWGYLIQDLEKLVNEGITLHNGQYWHVRLLFMTGDQLEHAHRLGLAPHFGGTYFDRLSYMPKKQRLEARTAADLRHLQESQPRSQEEAAKDIEVVETGGGLSRGQERKPAISSIPFFNPFQLGSTAPCSGHDWFCGVVRYDIQLCFKWWLSQGWVTVEELNDALNKFRDTLEGKDRKDFIVTSEMKAGSALKVKGNMAQCRAVSRLLTICLDGIFGPHQDRKQDTSWTLLKLMAEISAQLGSFVWTTGQVEKFTDMYDQYLDLRYSVARRFDACTTDKGNTKKARPDSIEDSGDMSVDELLWRDEAEPVPAPSSAFEDEILQEVISVGEQEVPAKAGASKGKKRTKKADSDVTVKPKHCTMLAYGRFVTAIGPPAHYSTLIMETKNGLMSRYMTGHRNFKNPIFSLQEYVEVMEHRTYETCPEFIARNTLQSWNRKLLSAGVLAAIEGDSEFPVWSTKCEVKGVLFQKEDYVAYYRRPELNGTRTFSFGLIQVIVASHDSSQGKLIVSRQEHEEQDSIAAWEVEDIGEVEAVSTENLACHCPFPCIKRRGKPVIVTKVAAPTVHI